MDLHFTADVYLFFYFMVLPQNLWAPSADRCETLPHDWYLDVLFNFLMQALMGPFPKIGAKTCKISGNFIQLQIFIANVSVKSRYPKLERRDREGFLLVWTMW